MGHFIIGQYHTIIYPRSMGLVTTVVANEVYMSLMLYVISLKHKSYTTLTCIRVQYGALYKWSLLYYHIPQDSGTCHSGSSRWSQYVSHGICHISQAVTRYTRITCIRHSGFTSGHLGFWRLLKHAKCNQPFTTAIPQLSRMGSLLCLLQIFC